MLRSSNGGISLITRWSNGSTTSADQLLEVGEVDHHAERVELLRRHVHPHPVVVPVQVLAAAAVAADLVRGGEGEVLEDGEHSAARQKGAPALYQSGR